MIAKDIAKTLAVASAAVYLVVTTVDIRVQADREAYEKALPQKCITLPAKRFNSETKKKSTSITAYAKYSDPARTRAEEIYSYIFSDDEKQMLIKLTMAEAGGEDTIGKALVIKTVINRMESEDFPDTIEEIITQKSQFSSVTDDGRYYEMIGNEDCELALQMVEHGWDDSQGALYFESCTEECWQSQNREFLFRHGGHNFYR